MELFSGEKVITGAFRQAGLKVHLGFIDVYSIYALCVRVSERWCEVMSKHFMNITVLLVSYRYVQTHVYVCVCGTPKLRRWYDVTGRGSSNDILSTAGFLTALRDVMRLAKGALLWIGLPCSSCLGLVCIYLCMYVCVCVCEYTRTIHVNATYCWCTYIHVVHVGIITIQLINNVLFTCFASTCLVTVAAS